MCSLEGSSSHELYIYTYVCLAAVAIKEMLYDSHGVCYKRLLGTTTSSQLILT